MKRHLLFITIPTAILFFIILTATEKQESNSLNDFIRYKIEQKKNKKAEPGYPDKAMQWYYEQRAYPNGEIPVGWREAAENHIRSNNLAKPGQQQNLNWTPQGPGNIGGRIRAIAIHPTDPNIVYLGAVSGGVWKSVNGGTSWTALKDHMENLAVCALAMDPLNPNILYAGTGEGYFNLDAIRGEGIFKSTDAGATWNRLASTNNQNFHYVNKLEFDNSAQVLYAATRKGLFASTDGGNSFITILYDVNGGDVHCADVEVAYTTPSTIYATFGLFNTFVLFRSTDGGNSYYQNLTVENHGRVEIATSPSNPYIAYLAMADINTSGVGKIGYTSNGGNNWFEAVVPGPTYSGQNNYAGTQGWYNNILAVDPQNPAIIFAGGIDLWKSTSSGTTWTQLSNWYSDAGSPQYVHADFHAIEFAPSNPNIMYLGNDGGIYKSTNRGTTWTGINNNLAITQFYYGAVAQSGGGIYGGTQDNGTLRTTGNSSWNTIIGGDGGATEVNYNNPNIVYGEYVHLCFFKSTDGGNSFNKKMNGIPVGANYYDGTTDRALFIAPYVMSPDNPDILIAGTYKVYRTTNGAENWTAISGDLTGDGTGSTGATISALSFAKGNPDILYAGCSNGIVQVTQNAGGSWASRSSGLPTAYCTRIAVDPGNPSTAYATFSGYEAGKKIYKTTNYGTNWTNISGNLPNIPVNCVFINPNKTDNIIVGTDLGIFVSESGSTQWAQNNSGLANVPVLDLDFRSDGKLFAATHGRGMYSTDLGGGGSSVLDYVYDDGNPTGGYNWTSAGQSSVNRITPTLSNAKLMQMSIYFLNPSTGTTTYTPVVLRFTNSKPGTDYAVIPAKTASAVPGWDVTDLSSYNITVNGEFFVGLKYDGVNMPNFGYDTGDNGRAWDNNGTGWVPWNETYFMRASVQTVTSSAEIDTRIPDKFEISANYPNPFNPSTKFRYALPNAMNVKVIIYDITGKQVAELVNNYQAPGSYEVTWNGKNDAGDYVSSGIYFYRVDAGKYSASSKMVLLK